MTFNYLLFIRLLREKKKTTRGEENWSFKGLVFFFFLFFWGGVQFSFYLAKRINHPDPGWARAEFAFLRWPLSLWPRDSGTGSWESNESGDSKIAGELWLGVKTRLRWSADRVSLHPRTWIRRLCKRKVQRCLSANGLSFSELFDDISLISKVRRLCVVADSLISAANVCDCVISAWCWQVCDHVVELQFRQNILCQPLILFRRCLA